MTDQKRVTLSIPRDTGYLRLVRQTVVEIARGKGFGTAAVSEIEMAVDEAASNAIRHAGGEGDISVVVVADERGLAVTVADGGKPFSFERAGSRDLETYLAERSVGGLGVYIIKRFMDEVEYRHRPDTGNELRMRKYLCRTSTS